MYSMYVMSKHRNLSYCYYTMQNEIIVSCFSRLNREVYCNWGKEVIAKLTYYILPLLSVCH